MQKYFVYQKLIYIFASELITSITIKIKNYEQFS